MAAAYLDEPSVETFLRAVNRGIYPRPIVKVGKQPVWARDKLRQVAIVDADGEEDLAGLL